MMDQYSYPIHLRWIVLVIFILIWTWLHTPFPSLVCEVDAHLHSHDDPSLRIAFHSGDPPEPSLTALVLESGSRRDTLYSWVSMIAWEPCYVDGGGTVEYHDRVEPAASGTTTRQRRSTRTGKGGRFRNAGNTQEREDLERGGTVTEKDEENHKQEQSHSLVEGQTYCGSQ